MFTPNFGQEFFAKHQHALVAFANSRVGRMFFAFKGVAISEDFKVYEIMPNRVSGNWRYDKKRDRVVMDTVFFRRPRFQLRFEQAYAMIARVVTPLAAWRLLQPQGAMMALPLFALTTSNFTDPGVDGQVQRESVNETFATIRAGAGNFADPTGGTTMNIGLRCSASVNQFSIMWRSILTFDTSSIDDGDVIESATLSLYGNDKDVTIGTTTAEIVAATPASNTTLVAADYAQTGSTSFGSIANAAFTAAAYMDVALNASGLANISKTGYSRFGVRSGWDYNNSFTGTWIINSFGYWAFQTEETSGSKDPKLSVTHSAPATGFKNLLLMRIG